MLVPEPPAPRKILVFCVVTVLKNKINQGEYFEI